MHAVSDNLVSLASNPIDAVALWFAQEVRGSMVAEDTLYLGIQEGSFEFLRNTLLGSEMTHRYAVHLHRFTRRLRKLAEECGEESFKLGIAGGHPCLMLSEALIYANLDRKFRWRRDVTMIVHPRSVDVHAEGLSTSAVWISNNA